MCSLLWNLLVDSQKHDFFFIVIEFLVDVNVQEKSR